MISFFWSQQLHRAVCIQVELPISNPINITGKFELWLNEKSLNDSLSTILLKFLTQASTWVDVSRITEEW
jgi:hypothetical protein